MGAEGLEDLKGKLWDEVWAHSRHLETMRSQYLGFFFTAVLAVTAIAAKDLAADGLRTTGSLVAFSALMLGLEVLTAFMLLAIRRIGHVLGEYRKAVFQIRDAAPQSTEPWAQLPGPSERYAVSTQGAAELVLYAALGAFLIALLSGAVRSHVVGDLTSAVCWAVFAMGLIAAAVCLRHVGLPRRPAPGDHP
jgi:hypothetical protein